MKTTTRVYLDAALQNIKSVAFFAFLPVLIARLGASDFEIALSNCVPPLFCALSLAFITRQLPVTRTVYLTSGYIRQAAFLSMALSVLLPHPIPWLLAIWSINAVAVMVTGAQQPAILRRHLLPGDFPRIFSTNKLIGIVITVAGSYAIGLELDAWDRFFPYNYAVSMLAGCLSTFTGMALIAGLAPNEKIPIRFTRQRPLQEADRKIWWMAFNNMGVSMAGPLFTIYHVKQLHLSNVQIGYFVVASGVLSALLLPLVRRWVERAGSATVYGFALLGMAAVVLPYGWIQSLGALILLQAWIGLCQSVLDVSSQSVMMDEAAKHQKEMAYFSDFQLLMNAGNGIGALAAGFLVSAFPVWLCFVVIAVVRFGLFVGFRVYGGSPKNKRLTAALHPAK